MQHDDELKKLLLSENISDINTFLRKKSHKIKDIVYQTKANIAQKPAIKTVQPNNVEFIEKPSPVLYIDKSEIHGYGVFTKNQIDVGDVIETCYTIELEFRDKYHKDKTILNYTYALNRADHDTNAHGNKLVLLTGNGMLYNHSLEALAEWRLFPDSRQAILIAIKDIQPTYEITIDYGPGYWNRK